MPEFLELTVDKFTFKVPTDRFYTREGAWVSLLPVREGTGVRVRIGLSDFLQQRSGDIAFVEVKPIGTTLTAGDEIASIETIKVNVALGSPVSGTVAEINPDLEIKPEVMNQDPYGSGWLAVITASDWETDRVPLLDPQAYLAVMKAEADEEMKKP